MSKEKNTDILAKYCADLQYEDIPADVLEKTKQVFFDCVGMMLGSAELDKGLFGIGLAEQMGKSDECTIIGTKKKVSAMAAAYANGELSHSMDHCIIMPPAHMSSFMIPAVLSVAELTHATGKDLLLALVLAIDVASRVGLSQGGFRIEVTEEQKKLPRAEQLALLRSYGLGCICFGGAAGVTRLLGGGEDQIKDSLGLAGFMLPEPSHNRSLFGPARQSILKYSPAGWQNLVSVAAGLMAKSGARGDREIFDGDHGFWAMQGTHARLEEKLTENLGKFYAIRDVRYKYYPCNGTFQAACNVTEALVNQYNIKPEDIKHLSFTNEYLCSGYLGDVIEYVSDISNSYAYCVSCAAHLVPVGPKWHMRETMKNQSILDLMERIECVESLEAEVARQKDNKEGMGYINRRPTTVTITLKDGTVYTQSQEFMRFMSCGVPEYAITNDQLEGKFRRNSEFTLAPEQQQKAIEAIWNLENINDVATGLMPLLVP